MMIYTSAPQTPDKVVRFSEPVKDGDQNLPNIYAREEDHERNALNNVTFDEINDLDMCFGHYKFTQRHFTLVPRRPDRSEYYFINQDDDVCCCGYHVSSQLSYEEKTKAGYRIYIPRLRVHDPNFNHTHAVHDEIANQLGKICNIEHIELLWLPEVGDFSAFVYLNLCEPFKQNHAGQTALCNLSCPKCKSLAVHINKNIFWMLLPPH